MSSKFGWEKGDIEIVKQPVKKAKSYAEAARLLAIVERAGARHNASDNTLIQQAHDILCDLGAACKAVEVETLTADDLRRYAPNPMLKAAVDALVLRHPGHANQKTHGNRFGAGQAKESLRRLKDDKGAREKYKESHRGRQGISSVAKQAEKATSWDEVKKIPGIQSAYDKAHSRIGDIDTEISKMSHTYASSGAGKKAYDALITEKVKLHSGIRKIYKKAKQLKPGDVPHSPYGVSTSYRLSSGKRLDTD